ncbi:Hypoxia-responsive family protein-like [Zostera marina]|uniref:Hypoxia-responsive family protein-like n=1 Tax=Zostera marina TaxID=29655 RepID=A0A0K9PQN4_ZOSMR|nr:Hypoxia-responsive family protein-like [Zostera marina]
MASKDEGNTIESFRKWLVQNKLKAVGCLWLSGITGSIAYNWSRPNMKTSVKIIHARLNAQALTLAALAGAAVVEYYDREHESTVEKKYPNPFLQNHEKQQHKEMKE